MNIKYVNVPGGGVSFLMEHKGETVSLDMSPLISKETTVKKDGMHSPLQFEPITLYMAQHKLEDKVFKIYKKLEERFLPNYGDANVNISKLITEELYALFKVKTMNKWVINNLGRKPLESLPTKFNVNLNTGFGNEAQTYLKHEYIDLCSFITMLKIILPPIIHYQNLVSNENKDKKAYDIINLISDTEFMEHPAVDKMRGLIDVLRVNGVDDIQVPLKKNINTSDIDIMIISVLIINKLLMASFLEDNDDRHIVKVLHGKTKNMVNIVPGSSYIEIGKETAGDQAREDKLSVLENIRVQTKLSIGDVELVNWFISGKENRLLIYDYYGFEYNDELWNEVYLALKPISHKGISPLADTILGWVCSTTSNDGKRDCLINPLMVNALRKETIHELVTTIAIYFITNNKLTMAMFVSSLVLEGESKDIGGKALSEENKLFLNKLTYNDYLRDRVNKISLSTRKNRYLQLLPERFIIGNRNTDLGKNNRNDLAEVLIWLNKVEK